jgi:NAD(P)-dependent dehydrogenase (short-subunit alcohol dehydrogenase family)
MSQFAGKVALITGGNAGIGRATATEFAKQGAKVVISGRREKEGHDVIAEIKALGGEAIFVKTDVSKESDVKVMIEQTMAKFTRLDFALNKAGVKQMVTRPNKLRKRTIKSWIMSKAFGCRQHEIPAMLKTGGGAIVNNSQSRDHRPCRGADLLSGGNTPSTG